MQSDLKQAGDAPSGLDGVVAADTALSHVDGEAGRLVIAGYDAEDLTATCGFEDAAALLWDAAGVDPAPDAAHVADGLGAARAAAFRDLDRFLDGAHGLTVIEGLRAGLAMIPDQDSASGLPIHVRLVGAVAVYVAALCRRAEGAAPVAPDPALGHAADFLRMLRGSAASSDEVEAMDTYLTLISDHGMNASTFAARVVASTQAGAVSAVVGALCALKGPLHGGAPGPVLDMLDGIGTPQNIAPWLEKELAKGERLMGFGHRIYRVRDPRADVLNAAVARLPNDDTRIAFARTVEKAALAALAEAKPDRPLDTNVEFYTALLLEALRIPRAAFTPTFAVGRVAGWTAHIVEQERTGRLIRPQSRYIGPMRDRAA